MTTKHAKINKKTAIFLVISNMIGTGVFTSLGFQLSNTENVLAIILIWFLGGVLAIIGALTTAELGTIFKVNGGDYIFILNGIGKSWAFVSAFVSIFIAFIATASINALAMEAYLAPFDIPNLRLYIIGFILLITFIHSLSVNHGSRLQDITTWFKIVFIIVLIGLGIYYAPTPNSVFNTAKQTLVESMNLSMAMNLLYVNFAYIGWNAAVYLAADLENPRKNLPFALIIGTSVVTIIYILFQIVMLNMASKAQLVNQADVTLIAFRNYVSPTAIKFISAGIGLQLLATMSAFIWIGSRILQSMGEKFYICKYFSKQNNKGIALRSLWFNGLTIIIVMYFGSLKQILISTSFILQFTATLVIVSYFRIKKPADRFKSPWSPYIQIIFVCINFGFLIINLVNDFKQTYIGFGILILIFIFYWISNYYEKKLHYECQN